MKALEGGKSESKIGQKIEEETKEHITETHGYKDKKEKKKSKGSFNKNQYAQDSNIEKAMVIEGMGEEIKKFRKYVKDIRADLATERELQKHVYNARDDRAYI